MPFKKLIVAHNTTNRRLAVAEITEILALALTVEMLQVEICRRARFLKGVGHFDRTF